MQKPEKFLGNYWYAVVAPSPAPRHMTHLREAERHLLLCVINCEMKKKKKNINKSKRCQHTFEIDIAIHRVFRFYFFFFSISAINSIVSLSMLYIFAFILLYFPRDTAPQCQQLCHFSRLLCFPFFYTSTSPPYPYRIASRTYNNFIQFPAHNNNSKKKIKQKHFIRMASGQTHYILCYIREYIGRFIPHTQKSRKRNKTKKKNITKIVLKPTATAVTMGFHCTRTRERHSSTVCVIECVAFAVYSTT